MSTTFVPSIPEAWRSPEVESSFRRVRWDRIQSGGAVPPPELIFRALEFFSPRETRVVILGQDPYPQPGKATGLAFGQTSEPSRVGDSLTSIARAVEACGMGALADRTLESWARQGVLLLNACLTTRPDWVGAHGGLGPNGVGWEAVVRELLTLVRDLAPGATWMVWGRDALARVRALPGAPPGNMRISSHPSPMSATRQMGAYPPFLGCNMFRETDGIVWGER